MDWSSGDVVEFTYAYFACDHPAMGMDGGPVMAFRKERDADLCYSEDWFDGVTRLPCAIDEQAKTAWVVIDDHWVAVSFVESDPKPGLSSS